MPPGSANRCRSVPPGPVIAATPARTNASAAARTAAHPHSPGRAVCVGEAGTRPPTDGRPRRTTPARDRADRQPSPTTSLASQRPRPPVSPFSRLTSYTSLCHRCEPSCLLCKHRRSSAFIGGAPPQRSRLHHHRSAAEPAHSDTTAIMSQTRRAQNPARDAVVVCLVGHETTLFSSLSSPLVRCSIQCGTYASRPRRSPRRARLAHSPAGHCPAITSSQRCHGDRYGLFSQRLRFSSWVIRSVLGSQVSDLPVRRAMLPR